MQEQLGGGLLVLRIERSDTSFNTQPSGVENATFQYGPLFIFLHSFPTAPLSANSTVTVPRDAPAPDLVYLALPLPMYSNASPGVHTFSLLFYGDKILLLFHINSNVNGSFDAATKIINLQNYFTSQSKEIIRNTLKSKEKTTPCRFSWRNGVNTQKLCGSNFVSEHLTSPSSHHRDVVCLALGPE